LHITLLLSLSIYSCFDGVVWCDWWGTSPPSSCVPIAYMYLLCTYSCDVRGETNHCKITNFIVIILCKVWICWTRIFYTRNRLVDRRYFKMSSRYKTRISWKRLSGIPQIHLLVYDVSRVKLRPTSSVSQYIHRVRASKYKPYDRRANQILLLLFIDQYILIRIRRLCVFDFGTIPTSGRCFHCKCTLHPDNEGPTSWSHSNNC